MTKNSIWKTYVLYDLRWILAAIPGALFFDIVAKIIPGVYLPMIISQCLLGLIFFWVDRKILK